MRVQAVKQIADSYQKIFRKIQYKGVFPLFTESFQ